MNGRPVALCAALALAAPAPAQEPHPPTNLDAPSGPARPQRPGLLPLRERRREAARPPSGKEERWIYPESADEIAYGNDGVLVARGNIKVRYAGSVVTCDRATFDRNRRYATFESRVTLETQRQTVYAEKVSLNVDTREFEALEGRTSVPPDLIGQSLLQPLRIWGKRIAREGERLVAQDGFLTTCDLPYPHVKIGFGQATVIPKRQIILRNATLYRYNTILARIRHLTIPIADDLRYSWAPLVGRTNEEGYFIKAAIGYSLARMLPGLLKVDLMEKKGIGLGFDQAYRFGDSAAGKTTLYSLRDRNRGVSNLNGRVEHEQRLGEIDARLSADFQNNSYQSITSNSKTQNTTLTLTRQISGGGSTGLSLNLSGSDFGASSSQTFSYSLTQSLIGSPRGRERPTGGFRAESINLRLNGTDSENRQKGATSSRTGRQEQNGDIKARGSLGLFDFDLSANKQLLSRQTSSAGAVSGGFFGGTERLPDLLLTTTLAKLFPGRRGAPGEEGAPAATALAARSRVPNLNLTLGYGRFLEGVQRGTQRVKLDTDRLLFGADLPSAALTLNEKLTLSLGATFRQMVYDGGAAAQYVLTHNASLTRKLGERSQFNLTYGYLRPYGGVPIGFRLDQNGSNNSAGANLSVDERRTRFSLLTGYDIQRAQAEATPGLKRNPWQNLALQLQYQASATFLTRFTGAYDINSGRPIDLTNRSQVRRGAFALDTGFRYDPRTRKFPQITEALSMSLAKDTRLIAYSGYNGVRSRFDYKSFALTQSFHDYELTLSYIDQPFGFRSEKGFNLSFRLKAFLTPAASGGGRFGTALDTGVGQVY